SLTMSLVLFVHSLDSLIKVLTVYLLHSALGHNGCLCQQCELWATILNCMCVCVCVCVLDLWVEDEGLYWCEAQNPFGKIQTQATISVTGLCLECVVDCVYLHPVFGICSVCVSVFCVLVCVCVCVCVLGCCVW